MYWRLYYPDDSFIDEPLTYGTIKNRRPGAVGLAACHAIQAEGKDIRQPFCKLNLFGLDDDKLYKPIWYRKYSADSNFPGNANFTGKTVRAVVFGFAIEKEHTIEQRDNRTLVHVPVKTTIFASLDDKSFINCPQWAIDKNAIENLISENI